MYTKEKLVITNNIINLVFIPAMELDFIKALNAKEQKMEENGSEIITTDGSETVMMDGAEMLATPEVHDPSLYETVVSFFNQADHS